MVDVVCSWLVVVDSAEETGQTVVLTGIVTVTMTGDERAGQLVTVEAQEVMVDTVVV